MSENKSHQLCPTNPDADAQEDNIHVLKTFVDQNQHQINEKSQNYQKVEVQIKH